MIEFPKELYVTKNNEDPPQFFGIRDVADDRNLENGDEIAVYELKRVGEVQITGTVVDVAGAHP